MEPAVRAELEEIVNAGRIMYEAGRRMVQGIQRLRENAGGSGEFKIGANPYVILGLSVGGLLLIGAMLRHRES